MCTAITLNSKDFYFGRNLDYEFSYGEEVVILPRNYLLQFRHIKESKRKLAIVGMAHVFNDYPLFYDGMNEKGLAIAGLNFVGKSQNEKVWYYHITNFDNEESLCPQLFDTLNDVVRFIDEHTDIIFAYLVDKNYYGSISMLCPPTERKIKDKDGNLISTWSVCICTLYGEDN